MIVDLLLGAVQAALVWVAGLFPNDPVNFEGYLNTVGSNLGALNYFLPIAETFVLVVGILVVFPLFMGTTLSLWVLAQIRGSSSRG